MRIRGKSKLYFPTNTPIRYNTHGTQVKLGLVHSKPGHSHGNHNVCSIKDSKILKTYVVPFQSAWSCQQYEVPRRQHHALESNALEHSKLS